MNYDIVVSDEAFRYLTIQRGSLDHLKSSRRAWEGAYRKGLRASYELMKPHLPAQCVGILDVGAGLGGIDVLLSRHYGGVPLVTLLDGENDQPKLRLHALTTGSRAVALRFQSDNGVLNADYVSPGNLVPRPVNLIVSTGAWCFHFPPSEYLRFVTECALPGAVLITDVRLDRPEWRQELERSAFESIGIAALKSKRAREVFRRAA